MSAADSMPATTADQGRPSVTCSGRLHAQPSGVHPIHDVTGHHDRATPGDDLAQDAAEDPAGHRVDRLERLVEQEQRGGVHESAGQAIFFFIPAE